MGGEEWLSTRRRSARHENDYFYPFRRRKRPHGANRYRKCDSESGESMAVDVQNGGIVFGNWKLLPTDKENWELCEWYAPKGTDDAPSWHRIGKYYNEHTIGSALRYAADREMKAKCKDHALKILEALEMLDATLSEFTERLSEGLRER